LRRSLLLALGAALALGPCALAQNTLYVDDSNPVCPGDGTTGHPFCTIQSAYGAALTGDTVRVRAGTYHECVRYADSTPPKNVHLVSEAGAAQTTIDGTGLNCVTSGSIPTGVVRIGGLASSMDGFRVIGGTNSGIVAIGEVTITNNVIENNTSGAGGGMYLYPNPCAYGSADIVATGNTVRNNLASFQNDARPGLGGGVYVNAGAPGGACAGNVTVSLQNNTITGNNSDASGAGVFAFTNTALGQTASITITQNTVDNNAAGSLETYSNGDYVLGFGGGVYVSTYGYGVETINVNTNQVRGNSSEFDFGGGISAAGQASLPANQTVRVQNNTVTGNTADVAGGGIEAFLHVIDLPATDTARIVVEGNTVTGNTASLGGAGVIARASSERSASGNAEVRVQGNRISGNTSEFFGGGVEVNVSADSDPEDGAGVILPASMTVTLENNRIDANTVTTGQNPPDGTAGGVFVLLNSRGDSTATANLRLNTIWNNTIDDPAGVGGVHIENETTLDTMSSEGFAQMSIDSSILGHGNGLGVGGPASGEQGVFATGLGTFNFDLSIDYSDFFGFTAGNFDTWVVPGVGNILNDPLLNATTLVPSACSPTIDAGNPALPFTLEPAPNGGRVNMGHTGNTAQAVPSLADANGDGIVDGIDVVRLSVAFGSSTGQPRFNATTDFDSSGQVDGTDLAFLAGDFGETCP
jgi:hypothetical protein